MADYTASQPKIWDSFDRANDATTPGTMDSGHAWTVINTNVAVAGIYNNKMYAVSDGTTDRVYIGVDIGELDVDIQFDFTISSTGETDGFEILTDTFAQASRNGYFLQWTSSSGLFRMLIINAGVATVVSGTSATYAEITAGSTFHARIRQKAGVVTYWIDAHDPVSFTPASHNTSEHTIVFWDIRKYGTTSGSMIDNFQVGTLNLSTSAPVNMSVTGSAGSGGESYSGTVDVTNGVGQTLEAIKNNSDSVSISHSTSQSVSGAKTGASSTTESLSLFVNVSSTKGGIETISIPCGVGQTMTYTIDNIIRKEGTVTFGHGIGIAISNTRNSSGVTSETYPVNQTTVGVKGSSSTTSISHAVGQTISYTVSVVISGEGVVDIAHVVSQTVSGLKDGRAPPLSYSLGVGQTLGTTKNSSRAFGISAGVAQTVVGGRKVTGSIYMLHSIGQTVTGFGVAIIAKQGTVAISERPTVGVGGQKTALTAILLSQAITTPITWSKAVTGSLELSMGIGQYFNYVIGDAGDIAHYLYLTVQIGPYRMIVYRNNVYKKTVMKGNIFRKELYLDA